MALQVLARSSGLELAASGVTCRRYNQLNYDPEIYRFLSTLLTAALISRAK